MVSIGSRRSYFVGVLAFLFIPTPSFGHDTGDCCPGNEFLSKGFTVRAENNDFPSPVTGPQNARDALAAAPKYLDRLLGHLGTLRGTQHHGQRLAGREEVSVLAVPGRTIAIHAEAQEPGESLVVMPIPREMTTFEMPRLPEPGPGNDVAGAHRVLQSFIGHFDRWLAAGGEPPALDLAGLPADALRVLNETLGEGEVSAIVDASQEIRNKHLTREEGVALVKRFDGEVPQRYISEVLDHIGMTVEEFDSSVTGQHAREVQLLEFQGGEFARVQARFQRGFEGLRHGSSIAAATVVLL